MVCPPSCHPVNLYPSDGVATRVTASPSRYCPAPDLSFDGLLLAGGDYEAVLGRMRPDVAETVTAEDLQSLVLRQTDGAGVYKEIDSVMATGQSSNGEDYGVAVVYCKYSKKNVLFRLAFDTSYELIGLEVRKP